MSRKKALFIGDFSDARYHPATGIDAQIAQIIQDDFTLTVTEVYSDLTFKQLQAYDLLINYADQWEKRGSAGTVGALLAYAADGGAVLGLHSGIIAPMETYPEIPVLFGGRFDHHPPYETLAYVLAEQADHPIVAGFEPFSMREEPYQFVLCPFSKRLHLLDYIWQGKRYPAAWTVQFGTGRIVYLSPGHDSRSFAVPAFQELIRRSASWAAGAGPSVCPTGAERV